MKYTKLKLINEFVAQNITPMKMPETIFEMYSVPIFETGHPEFLCGREIGSSKIVVKKNDILLCKINPRINRVWVVSDESEKINIASSEWIVVRSSIYNPEFLAWYFRTPKFRQLMLSEVTGIGGSLTRAQPKRVAEYPVPVLTREKQDAVVKVLNAVKYITDIYNEQLRKLDILVKSRFFEMFGNITEIVPLSYYIAELNAGKSLAGEGECPNKVLKTGAVTYDYFDLTQVKNLPLDYEPLEEHRVNTGDVIISRMNTAELVGAAAYVWKAPEHTYLPDRLWRAEIKNTACPIFVWQMLIQSNTKESIRLNASGTSGSMKNISKPRLLGIQVKKVDLVEQNQFAAFVAQIDKSKLAVQKSLEKLEILKKSLMQQYFGQEGTE